MKEILTSEIRPELKVGDIIFDGTNDSRSQKRREYKGKVLYVDDMVILVKPLGIMQKIHGDTPMLWNCKYTSKLNKNENTI